MKWHQRLMGAFRIRESCWHARKYSATSYAGNWQASFGLTQYQIQTGWVPICGTVTELVVNSRGTIKLAETPIQRTRTIQASTWTIVGYGASNAMRLVGNMLLTRLLFPEAFGLMALVNAFVIGLAMFSDVGIGPSIIQNSRGDDPAFLNTAFTIQAARGVALWFCSCILAWPVSHFYGKEELLFLMPVVCLNALISGFNSTKLFTCNRHLRLGRLNILELGSAFVGLLVMIAAASISRTVWSLVAGGLLSTTLKMVFSHRLEVGRSDRFGWDPSAKVALFKFGRWIFASSVISFLAAQADRLLLGKLLTLELLGIYSVAYFLAGSIVQLNGELSRKVLFPVLSMRAAAGEDPRLGMMRFKLAASPIVLWLMALLGGFAQQVIQLLYDERYSSAGWMLATFCLGRVFNVVVAPTGHAMLACGKPDIPTIASLFEAIAVVSGMLLGFHVAGERGAVIAAAFAGAVPAIVFWAMASRCGLSSFRLDVTLVVFAGASTVLVRSTSTIAASLGLQSTLGVQLVTAAAVSFLWGAFVWRNNRELLASLFASLRGRARAS